MPKAKVATPDWVLRLDEAVTRVSRAARSPKLHQLMGAQAKVELGEHLHLTLAMLGAGQPLRVSDLATQLDVETLDGESPRDRTGAARTRHPQHRPG